MKPQDTISGVPVELTGERLEEFEEQLTSLCNWEVGQAEDYLEESIRPRIAENYQYYNREKPERVEGQASFVDNTCQAVVDHYVAHAVDAFTESDTLEVIPEANSNRALYKVVNAVVNDVLDSENSRYSIYHSFFTDAFISGAAILRPHIVEEPRIDKEFFNDVTEEELNIRYANLEMSMEWDRVEQTIKEERTEEITYAQQAPEGSVMDELAPEATIGYTESVTTYSGYFTLVKDEKTVKIEQIPAENFLINKDARSIEEANFVGHKAMIAVGELLDMGFEYDKVKEVSERSGGSDDAHENIASRQRRRRVLGDDSIESSLDTSQDEVEVFELYIRTALEETVGEEAGTIAIPKLYQVFMTENVLLSYQEVDFIPYVGTSPSPTPTMFWGMGMVDQTKHIQRARTGLFRQQFEYNDLAARPRFEYVPDSIHNTRDLFNRRAGAGIAVKTLGAIRPVQVTALAGDNMGMMGLLDVQRESGTGMSFTGQGMMGDVLKSGASTVSAQMVLSEGQMVQKTVIKTLLECAIKPLIGKIYSLLRGNINEWEITVEGESMVVNPNDWPRLREVRIKTPLGRSAKLEKAQALMSLYTTLKAEGMDALQDQLRMKQLLADAYTYQDIPEAASYMPSDEELGQRDQLLQTMNQLQQQMQQMQGQMQSLSQENQTLSQRATAYAQQELANDTLDSRTRAQKAQADAMAKADKQRLDEEKAQAEMAKSADEQALDERKFEVERADTVHDNITDDRQFALEQAESFLKSQHAREKGFKHVTGSM